MEINKIKKKYCTDNKVQVMFSNARNQIICSKDGYLYWRGPGINIHRYLSDPQRENMPYRSHPVSERHASHLFKFNQIYVKFTSDRVISGLWHDECYTLSFLYFQKTDKGAICAEMGIGNFTSEEETITMMNKNELEKFLYDASEVTGKYIFETMFGIRYVKSNNEEHSMKNFLDLSDNAILDAYNKSIEPIKIVDCYSNLSESNKHHQEEQEWQIVSSINDVKEFELTYSGILGGYEPMMVIIKDDEVIVYRFEIFYCSKDLFKVKSKKTKICPNPNALLKAGLDANYTFDPNFDK